MFIYQGIKMCVKTKEQEKYIQLVIDNMQTCWGFHQNKG